jgi:RimJ/RimL family protein N-acetyltransferase
MSDFPPLALEYWCKAFDGTRIAVFGDFTLSVVPTLDRKRPVMILERSDGGTHAAIRPELADAIGSDVGAMTAVAWRERLANEGVVFHDPDFLFYLPVDATPETGHVRSARRLTEDDHAAFGLFHSSASEEDREDAFVELDHWAVFGCFDDNRLVSAASAILWNESPIADLGVLTLTDARGKGYAHAAVQAINSYSRQQGYEPQYRCQLDNHASVALARACGLVLFGKWIVGTNGGN